MAPTQFAKFHQFYTNKGKHNRTTRTQYIFAPLFTYLPRLAVLMPTRLTFIYRIVLSLYVFFDSKYLVSLTPRYDLGAVWL